MYNKILYIGAGLHTNVINDFKNTKKFVFIDSKPRNEYGYEYYYRQFYISDFTNDLITSMKNTGFNLISKTSFTNNYNEINKKDLEPTLIHFSTGIGRNLRSEHNVNYYISTGCPNDFYNNNILLEDIKDCDSVIVSGHDPNSYFANYIKNPFHFIGYSKTCYPKNIKEYKNNQENTMSFLGYVLTKPEHIKSYTYINFDNGNKIVCKSYKDFYNLIKK